MDTKSYKTVVVSDIHLGSKHSKLKEVTNFLRSVDCELLILNGDIVDGWRLKSGKQKWDQDMKAFFDAISDKVLDNHTKVVYVTGNHDDFLDGLVPFDLFGMYIVNRLTIESGDKKYLVFHGHAFDSITTHFRWLAKLGDIGYNLLIKFNKYWNRGRKVSHLKRYSFSKHIKHKVKDAVNYISGFEINLASYTKSVGCQGVICGHIHRPEDKIIGDNIHYLNSGDWVESMTALLEDYDNHWCIYSYDEQDT